MVSNEHSHGLELLQTPNFVKPRSRFLSTVGRRFTSSISEETRRDSKTTGCGPKFQPRCHKPKVVTHCTHHHSPQGMNPYGLMNKSKLTGRETMRRATRMHVAESCVNSAAGACRWSLRAVCELSSANCLFSHVQNRKQVRKSIIQTMTNAYSDPGFSM